MLTAVSEQLGRAMRAGVAATLTDKEWRATLGYFQYKCAYCQHGNYEVLEHFIPIKYGGGTTQTNCVPACASCNISKEHPSFILLRSNEKAVESLLRVKAYFVSLAREDFDEIALDAYIERQRFKVSPKTVYTKHIWTGKQVERPKLAIEKEYFTLEEAEKELQIKRSTLYLQMNRLGIEAKKFKGDKRAFLSASDVERIKEVREKPWLLDNPQDQ